MSDARAQAKVEDLNELGQHIELNRLDCVL